jgi:hypothetical protein
LLLVSYHIVTNLKFVCAHLAAPAAAGTAWTAPGTNGTANWSKDANLQGLTSFTTQ